MSRYYYHPLGEYAQKYIDGNAAPNQLPHTYDKNEEGKTHGWSKLDWGVGPDVPVYSMTDGVIFSVFGTTTGGGKGYYVNIRTDRQDGTGKTVCIRYIELGGLSELTAPLVGVEAGPGKFSGNVSSGEINVPVKMGDLIGYTNNWYNNYSNVHIDFFYEGSSTEDYYKGVEYVPHCDANTKLDSAFNLKDLSSGVKAVYCNGNIVGCENGYVPQQPDTSSIYTVYPCLSYMVCLQKPIKMEGSVNGSIGTGNAPEGYYKDTIPITDEELNNACNCILGEIPLSEDGVEASRSGCLLYAKLIRRRWFTKAVNPGNSIMSILQNGGFYGWGGNSISSSKVSGMNYTINEFKEKVKQNICNPGLYDITIDKCIKIANEGPFYNYGYSPSGYNTNSARIESELEQKIIAKQLPSHSNSPSFSIPLDNFLGCVGNTGYWSDTSAS